MLGLSLVAAAMATGTSLAVRAQRMTVDLQNDESDARAYAQAGLDYGWQLINSNTNWRSAYTNNTAVTAVPFGRGTISFKLVDESDGNISNDSIQNARLYGIGRVGNAARLVSVQLTPTGPALNTLSVPIYSASAVSSSSGYVIGGPLTTGSMIVSLLCTFNGSIQSTSLVNLGTITGTTSGRPVMTMPSSTIFGLYSPNATAIPFSSLSGGKLQSVLLSPAVNPYGTPNAAGLYSITVSSGTLQILNARLSATLLVDLGVGAGVQIYNPVLWDPPTVGTPTLIIRGAGSNTITIFGSTTPLSEATVGVNFNPTSTPYMGTSNTTSTDTYPSEINGLIHIIGSSTTLTLTTGCLIKGVVLSEGQVQVNNGAIVEFDPMIQQYPPTGYITPTGMGALTGTWKREQDN